MRENLFHPQHQQIPVIKWIPLFSITLSIRILVRHFVPEWEIIDFLSKYNFMVWTAYEYSHRAHVLYTHPRCILKQATNKLNVNICE